MSDSKLNFTIAETPLSCLEATHTGKKRKAAALTVDNADAVFHECFDIDGFIKFLNQTFGTTYDHDLIAGFMNVKNIIRY
jgi:hypothetical protein